MQGACTVMLIEMPRFYVGKLLLHHYMSDLARLSYFNSLVIGISTSEILEKKLKNEGLGRRGHGMGRFYTIWKLVKN